MSKLTEALRTVGVYNSHEFANARPYIEYFPNDNGRGGMSARWCVYRKGDVPENWRSSATKTFIVLDGGPFAEVKARKLEAAKTWVSEKYGIKEWARTPFGTWMDAEFVKTRLAELKELIAKTEPAEK